jgi:hypothetical protein
MAMKKTSGADSPLRQGAGKSFKTILILGRRILIGYLGFSRRGVLIGEGATSGVGRGALTHRGPGQGQAAPPCCVGPSWPHSISSLVL